MAGDGGDGDGDSQSDKHTASKGAGEKPPESRPPHGIRLITPADDDRPTPRPGRPKPIKP